MAKPIFLVGFPMSADAASVYQVQQTLKMQLDDYHVLVYKEPSKEHITFDVLNAVDATDVELAELVERTAASVKSIIEGAKEIEKIITQNNQTNNDTV